MKGKKGKSTAKVQKKGTTSKNIKGPQAIRGPYK
jgi:hypothetical protein